MQTPQLPPTFAFRRNYFELKQRSLGVTSAPRDSGGFGGFGAVGGASGGGVDNPDQRICDDVGAFCRSSTALTLSLVKKVFNCAAFARVLWKVSPMLVYFLFGYAVVGTVATTGLFGKVWRCGGVCVCVCVCVAFYFVFGYVVLGTVATAGVFGKVSVWTRGVGGRGDRRAALGDLLGAGAHACPRT
eukprot:351099-Chlamydomonas_euryale.AAC.2